MTDYKYPIAKCPKCGRPIVYSDDPKDKTDVQVREAEPDYHGKHIIPKIGNIPLLGMKNLQEFFAIDLCL